MRSISDEIRKVADDYDELRYLANRIDAEMVELPRDRDGAPIHVGDTVYLDSGRKAEVTHIDLWQGEYSIGFSVCGNFFALAPEHFTHTRPDSWERIADELEEWSEDNRVNGDHEVFDRARDFSERVRKMAKKED